MIVSHFFAYYKYLCYNDKNVLGRYANMQVLDYGDIIPLRNITFEDGKYDMEESHPGIVLIPTSENDENAICLYMTTDKGRAKKYNYQYLAANREVSRKQSFINLKQLIKIPNIKYKPLNQLENDDFYYLLEKFYNFQTTCENPNEMFNEIKRKVEIMLQIFKMNNELGIFMDTNIDLKEVEGLEKTEDVELMHTAYLIEHGKIYIEDIPVTLLTVKEKGFLKELVVLYDELSNLDLKSIDISKESNRLKLLYLKTKNRNFFINTDELFKKAKNLMSLMGNSDEEIECIDSFFEIEKRKRKNKECFWNKKKRN